MVMLAAAKAITTDQVGGSYGVTLTSNASANVKGVYGQLIASTGQDAFGLLVQVQGSATGDYLIDLAIGGAGSEQIILSNFAHARQVGNTRRAGLMLIPLFIPSGTRISARCQGSTGGNNCILNITLLPALGAFTLGLLGRATTYGANTGTSGGISIDPGGTINTKGSYVQISASLTNPARWIVLMIGNQANAARANTANNSWTFDVAIGAAGSETIVIPDIILGAGAVESVVVPYLISLPFALPSGVRVAVRAQCTINDATDRKFDFSLLGID